ncbi:hypothetical protein EDC04DRAFT_2870723 [Pisolithus marmoratus]|nr:hypothetical protein EDC04DRAFT_2870723 [Pisolithus marmoratus]
MQWYAILQVEVEKQVDSILHGVLFGTSLDKGSDIHVAMDGNFHHHHQCSAGDSPSFYEPSYFLPKAQVDTIGCHITQACQYPSKRTKSIVPDEAIDQCEASYEAADGQKQKASMDGFDDTGLMALILLYDVGSKKSVHTFDIFDQAIMSHLHFATTEMHAYGHEWACQLVYNPCLITGLGLSDGEGTEHMCSHCRKRRLRLGGEW